MYYSIWQSSSEEHVAYWQSFLDMDKCLSMLSEQDKVSGDAAGERAGVPVAEQRHSLRAAAPY